MIRSAFALTALSTLCAAAPAQTGYAFWEISLDQGVTWTREATIETPQAIRVRLWLGWNFIPNALGFGGSQFDAIVQGARAGDTITNFERPRPFNFALQTLAASTYSGGLKIDVSTDIAAPGTGAGWISPGQGSPDGMPTDFNTSNPVCVFQYTLNLGPEEGTRIITHIFNSINVGRAISVYTSDGGAQVRMGAGVVDSSPAMVTVVPTPSTLGCVSGLGVLTFRPGRRRNHNK